MTWMVRTRYKPIADGTDCHVLRDKTAMTAKTGTIGGVQQSHDQDRVPIPSHSKPVTPTQRATNDGQEKRTEAESGLAHSNRSETLLLRV